MSVRGLFLMYLLILNDYGCGAVKSFKFFFLTVMKVSSNLALYCCDQDSVHVLVGKCHGKCFWWERERENTYNTAVYFSLDKDILKTYLCMSAT